MIVTFNMSIIIGFALNVTVSQLDHSVNVTLWVNTTTKVDFMGNASRKLCSDGHSFQTPIYNCSKNPHQSLHYLQSPGSVKKYYGHCHRCWY
nr:ORF4a [Bat alphacoronavirus PH201]